MAAEILSVDAVTLAKLCLYRWSLLLVLGRLLIHLCEAQFCWQSSAHTNRNVVLHTDVPILVKSWCVHKDKHV